MTATAHRKFDFNGVFEDDGAAVTARETVRRMYTAAEVEVVRAEAQAAGEQSVVAQTELRVAAALEEIARNAAVALSGLAQAAHDHREASAGLAMAVGRKIADAALHQFPEAPVAAALIELAREIEAEPLLKVQVAPDLVERVKVALERAAQACSFPGALVVTEDPDAPRAAFLLDWGEGRAVFDPEAAAARVAQALATALAAEGLHAEPIISTDETEHG